MPCPPARDLEAFALGDLPADSWTGLVEHLNGCEECSDKVAGFDLHLDGLTQSLHGIDPEGKSSQLTVSKQNLLAARAAFNKDRKPKSAPIRDHARSLKKALREGTATLGRFELIRKLGAGTFGTVFKARDPKLDRIVAVKVLQRTSDDAAEELERFTREAKSVAQLEHPNVISLFEAGETDDGIRYLVTEFIDGETLDQRRVRQKFSFRQSAAMAADIGEALHFAHENGVVHRDVKPSNIMVDKKGRPHVMDFGLARREVGDVTVTPTGRVLGTPAYMSPEIARGDAHRADGRSDVYSLGIIFYEMLTGERPFHGNRRMLLLALLEDEPRSPRQLVRDLPRDLETICMRAIERSPARRYSSAAAFAQDLRRYLAGEHIEARPVRRWERIWRWCTRNRLASSVFVALVFSASFGFWQLGNLFHHLVRSSAEESAAQYAELLEHANDLYASEVVARVKHHNVPATAEYAKNEGEIPLPATFLNLLTSRVSEEGGSGMDARHYSQHPFRTNPHGGPRDAFERQAIRWLKKHPEDFFVRVERYQGNTALRFARARIMLKSCVKCHNEHPDSTKTNWRVGDVRGVLEVIRPLQSDEDRIRAGMTGTFVSMGGISLLLILTILGIAIVGEKRRGR